MLAVMRRTSFAQWPCSIARTMDLLGDWWTPLVLREAFYGIRRFDAFQESLGIARNTLTDRLRRLVEEGPAGEAAVPGGAGSLRLRAHREGARLLRRAAGDESLGGPLAGW
ncbi:winged helix-turn-helix transcriptional regulator [Streptomyces mirabilis]|uniref:winged helix-turn-helix transcriptional regulator n=1 Tax=Streptomyces mirabilis TaxID=68239 RepID=UPI0036BC195C